MGTFINAPGSTSQSLTPVIAKNGLILYDFVAKLLNLRTKISGKYHQLMSVLTHLYRENYRGIYMSWSVEEFVFQLCRKSKWSDDERKEPEACSALRLIPTPTLVLQTGKVKRKWFASCWQQCWACLNHGSFQIPPRTEMNPSPFCFWMLRNPCISAPAC